MDEFEKREFWEALSRLYSATENLRASIEKLAEIATSHEKRVDRAEVLLDALRDEVNRLKRDRPQ